MTDGRKPQKGQSTPALCSGDVVIPNKKGLHARASAQFVKCAEMYDADVRVTHNGQTVLGTSIMGLMMLAASKESRITIETAGPEAHQAYDALVTLVKDGFNEDG